MADFLDSEAEESEEEEELSEKERKKSKKVKAPVSDSSEEDEDEDDERAEELKDLIDDNPIEESSSSSSESGDEASGGVKRKRGADDDEDDEDLSEEDFALLEENLGIKVKRKKNFRRVKRIDDAESDEDANERGDERDAIATELFEGSDGEEEHRDNRDKDRDRRDVEEENDQDKYSEEEDEDEDIGDFIVDAEGQPIRGGRKKRKAIYADKALQEAQDIFGVDFEYEQFQQDGEEYDEEEDEAEEYEGDEATGKARKKLDGKAPKKKSQRKTIYEVYEPSELERGHFTDFDERIRKLDIPERMQLRNVPIVSVEEGSSELDLEADWIYKNAFTKSSISNQDNGGTDGRERVTRGPQTVEKIRKALEFMRNQHLEVPFIAFYRKEYVQPELSINDLWRVYKYDENWTQLQTRKKNMMRLFEKMLKYQSEKLTRDVNESIPEGVRVLREDDIDRLRNVQSSEELNDVYNHFVLYYGNDVPAMQEAHRQKQREEARERKNAAARRKQNEDGEPMDVDEPGEDNLDMEEAQNLDEESTIKQAKRSDLYSLCVKANLDSFVKKYGLTPEQFAENLRDNYQRHEVDQYPTEPLDLALDYVSPKFPTATEVINAANYMLAVQIAREPLVRQCVREAFYERARIDVNPTKQGFKEIDENHALYAVKFLKDKPVRDLTDEQFLRLVVGEQDKLINIVFQTNIDGATTANYGDEVKQLFQRDEFSKLVQDWNELRKEVIDIALNKFIFPALVKEIRAKLLNEARESVLKACCRQLYNWLKVAPYKVDFPDDEDEWDTKNGIRVMALSYVADLDQAAFGCLVNVDGECTDHVRLEHIIKRKNAWKEMDRVGKEKDLALLRNFILSKKPHVIAVGGESREAQMLIEDIRGVVQSLVEDEQWPSISVELVDNNLAKVFANSTRAETEFREYPHLLREAISLARVLQDPLVEYSQLCNSDEEILCLKYHQMQDQLTKEELLEGLYLEFVNRTNEVGVDINRAINYPHTANLVQFVCGLGPRKGQSLMKILKQNSQRLENRTQLVTTCHMGPKVFINCAGFIKIDTNSLGDSTESYVEVLDGSRVHPETYEWARKMAVDALEYDDEDANPADAVGEILEAPERLKDLDLDAFADELERQGFGNKRITLYDIRSELNHRYKDLRIPYQPPSPEEVFNMLTKETPQTFFIGKLVMATVTGFQHRKPQREELDRANPNRNESTGLWQCPFCLQNDFPDLSEVWNHFDAGACTGQAVGVRIRLENSLSGFVPLKSLSDSEVSNPEERVRPGQTIHCRVTKIDVERFSVMATSKSSDLMDRNGEWRPPKDAYYDTQAEEAILRTEEESKKLKQRQSYTKRVIVHPSFKNIGFKEAEKLMAGMDQGEVVIRPSSKGTNHLTVTWKVGEGICQHVDVREEGKENAFSLGQSLWIGDEEFEDLDEIVARYINPMASHARDVYSFRYFRDLGITEENFAPGKERERADELIKEDKKKNPTKIHYFLSASREFPGKFMLTYLPRAHAKFEFITVTPEGFRFRGQVHDSLTSLFRWFKEHFRDPVPGTPRSSSGNQALGMRSSSRTPGFGSSSTPNVNPETLQRVAQSIPSHMLQSLSQAAHFGTPTPFSYPANTPYTPSGQTPFMTPFAATPHQPQTPRISSTPAPTATPSQPGVFRTPAAPAAPRGYGTQSYSNRQGGGSNRPGAPGNTRSGGTTDWDSWKSTPANGGNKPTSRSAGGNDPDDWEAASNAWAASTRSNSSWAGAKSTPASANDSSRSAADDWGASDSSAVVVNSNEAADAWAGVSASPKVAGRPAAPAASANKSSDWDDWGSSQSSTTTAPAASASKSSDWDDWGSSQTSKPTSSGNSWGSRTGGSGPRGSGNKCYKCNQEGHMSKDCTNPSAGGGGRGGVKCYRCNQEGHISRDCPNPSSSAPRGGGRGACYKCNQEGHISRDCPNTSNDGQGSKRGTCYKCNQPGHMSKDCPNPGSGGDRSRSRPSSRPPAGAPPASSSTTDDWGLDAADIAVVSGNAAAADDWASAGTSSKAPAPRPPAATSSSTDDWGDDWGSSGTSSKAPAPRAPATTSSSADDWGDDWGSSSTTSKAPAPRVPAATSSSADDWGDDWGSASKSSTPAAGSASKTADDWAAAADAWANVSTSSTPKSKTTPSASKNDDWGSSADAWANTSASSTPKSKTTPRASKSNDDWGSSSMSSWSAGGAQRSGGSRACYKCNQEGHISKDCPNSSNNNGGGDRGRRACYKCNQDGHISRDCPNSSNGDGGRSKACFKCNQDGHISRDCPNGGNAGGGGKRACYKCNQEGHISRDCPNQSGGGGSRERSSSRSRGRNDNWGGGSTSASPFATGANASPIRGSRPMSSASTKSTPADDWGLGASDSGVSAGGAAADNWASGGSGASSDNWGAKADAWASGSGGGSSRSRNAGRGSQQPSVSTEVWDSEPSASVTAAPDDLADAWLSGTTPRSGGRSRGSPRAMEMGDATPLYDE